MRELGIADVVEPDLARAVAGADCVMLCAPVGAFAALAAAIAPHLAPGAVVTDTGSTKQSVIRDLAGSLPAGVHLVPAHPMAGTEFSGPDAGFATLFDGRWCLLTPPPGTRRRRGRAGGRAVARHGGRDRDDGARRTTTGWWRSSATCRT